ncbi:MAG: SDR family NAD(P)-dependent oxidoreductase [Acidimicrobiales bacterium]
MIGAGETMDQLQGKVAVVTGGAGGLGEAMAASFLAEGMSVVVADIEETALVAAADRLAGVRPGAEVLSVITDVTDPTSVDALAEAARGRFGTVHVVCNNAGVGGHFGLSWEIPVEEWRWVLEVNLWGVIHGIRSFVPGLVAQGEGHVVNTASLAGWSGPPAMSAYAASKHAVLGISESLRSELELSGTGVGVSVLCPGMVNTGIMSSERNWPTRLGAEPVVPSSPLVSGIQQILKTGTTQGDVDPPAVAQVVVEGIKSNRFVLSTHPGQVADAARNRLNHAEAIPAV